MEYEEIEKYVKSILTEIRFKHSLGTAEKAVELAKKYGEDENLARILGITHDIAKEMTDKEYLEYVDKNNIEIDCVERKNPRLLHAKVGADVCKKKFGFSKEMQDVIKYHTTGNCLMSNMGKIIYIADKIEENRNYELLNDARKAANESLDSGMLFLLRGAINKSISKEKLIHIDTINLYNKLIGEKM